MEHSFLRTSTVLDLLSTHSKIIDELRSRGVLRTVNNPVADYAEFLACCALGLAPAEHSENGDDEDDPVAQRNQIKARRRAPGSSPTPVSAIHSLAEDHHDYVIA